MVQPPPQRRVQPPRHILQNHELRTVMPYVLQGGIDAVQGALHIGTGSMVVETGGGGAGEPADEPVGGRGIDRRLPRPSIIP